MSKFRTRPLVLLPIALGMALAASAAFAYFTLTGSGTGLATVGSASGAIKIEGTIAEKLFPGSESTVAIKVTNESAGPVYVNQVSLASIASSKAECKTTLGTGAWFEMPAVAVEAELKKQGESVERAGKLKMLDPSENQDACQEATLTLHFTSN